MLTQTVPLPIRWHALRKAQGRLDALVVVLARPQDLPFARALAGGWGQAVPHCHFVAGRADFHPDQGQIRDLGTSLGAKLRRLKLGPAQTILIGVGEAARCAFDLVMQSALAGLSAILVDMVPVSVAALAPPMGSALRFLRRDGDPHHRDADAMLHGLRQTAIDLRSMTLPPGPDAISRAIGGFLIELVARASPASFPSSESQS